MDVSTSGGIMQNLNEPTMIITVEEFERLKALEFKLQCLKNAGVDNWEGYDFAMEEYHNELS
jgi:hypothetical protein